MADGNDNTIARQSMPRDFFVDSDARGEDEFAQ